MHQPGSCTIRLDQHSDHANHTLIIHPQLAGLWGLSKFRFRLLHYCLEFDQSLRTRSICKSILSIKKGRVQFLSLIQQCLNLGVVLDHFRYKENCIFSIDSLKYVFETGPFHESYYGSQQVHECMETPQHQNNTFQVTILWCINDDFSSLPIQGLVKSYSGGKIVLRGNCK